jgi:hypothetical protein
MKFLFKTISMRLFMLLMGMLSCDMFSPRSVEQPQGVFKDPLHLSAILDNTGESFSKSAYEDILHPLFVFYAFDGKPWTRDDEINRFKSIVLDSTVFGIWDTCTGNIRERDTMTVCRKFKIVYAKSIVDSSIDSGLAELRLEYYSPKNTWTIRYWKEGDKKSIFNPEFQQ